MTPARKLLAGAALNLAAGAAIATPLAVAASDATVSALWGPGSAVTQAERHAAEVNAPAYGDVPQAHMPAGCINAAQPEGMIPAAVVVVTVAGDTVRLTLDAAQARAKSADAADAVWVVGTCAQ